MRDILFRGKSKDTNRWVYGYLIKGEWYMNDCLITAIVSTDMVFFPHGEISEWEEIDPDTVGQWTGLVDKNGAKVFEGDILSQILHFGSKPTLRVVTYEMSCGSCCTQVYGFGASGLGHTDFIRLDEPFEVIGNIHDNPELLHNG